MAKPSTAAELIALMEDNPPRTQVIQTALGRPVRYYDHPFLTAIAIVRDNLRMNNQTQARIDAELTKEQTPAPLIKAFEKIDTTRRFA